MYTYKYPHPAISVDILVFSKQHAGTRLLLIRRKNEPYKGDWAFPGGFMNIDETAEEAAFRELKEETNLDVSELRQVGAFSKVDRDPRERVVSIVFYTVVDEEGIVSGSDDAAEAKWFPLGAVPALAFDHAEILKRTLETKNHEL